MLSGKVALRQGSRCGSWHTVAMLTLAEIRSGFAYWPRLHDVAEHQVDGSRKALPSARLKHKEEDFCVDEVLPSSFTASGEGEHFWVQIQKQGLNTHDVIDSLAKAAGCRARDIGYSGLKDKRAVTTQWFSLPTASMTDRHIARNIATELPARLAGDAMFAEGCKLLDQFSHTRKLRTGTHSGNRFRIVLRDCDYEHKQQFETRLELIAQQGFPNYFGLQRFGIEGRNLLVYQRLAQSKRENKKRSRQSRQAQRARSLALSSARSLMFNAVLACRLKDKSCMCMSTGEPLLLADTGSFFICEEPDAELLQRLARHDVLTTGPLWGAVKNQDAALQAWQLRENAQWLDWSLNSLPEDTRLSPALLLQSGLQHQRRSLLSMPRHLRWKWQDNATLELEFTLPKGVYATALLRELCEINP